MKKFSLVVPVYQNEINLPETIPRLLRLLDRLTGFDSELVFVDDGSVDRSYEILVAHARRHPERMSIVKLTRNFGQTPAIQAGLCHARGDCVAIMSADLQEPEDAILDMVKLWQDGALFVIGERRARLEARWHQFVSGLYWRLVRRLALPDFPETGYDYCLLDRQIVNDVARINEKNSSIFVLIYWFGYRPAFVPITRAVRTQGSSQWDLVRKIRFTVDTLIGFTHVPARLIVYLSGLASVVSLVYFAITFVYWMLRGSAPPGWMTLAGFGFIGGSLMLFSLGIISEYLVRLLDEVRKRPPFVVERTIERDAAPSDVVR